MSEWIVIDYRGYWDVPREFVVRHGEEAYFFESPFDELRDDYTPSFRVYRIPPGAAEIPRSRWDEFRRIGERLADIPISQLRFRTEPIPNHPPMCPNLHFIHESVFNILQPAQRQAHQDPLSNPIS